MAQVPPADSGLRLRPAESPAATTAAFLSALAQAGARRVYLDRGDYLLDNHSGPLRIQNFSGHLIFNTGARLVFLDNTQGGLLFQGGERARVTGLHATYQTRPARRISPNEEIKFSDTTDTLVERAFVENSPSVGLLFFNSVRPRVERLTVRNTMADGLHFANCEDARVERLETFDTGDDGLAFVNYAPYPDKNGGMARQISVVRSKARGIAVAGASRITIDGFRVDGTASSGILCARDQAFQTRTPAEVIFQNGVIVNSGTVVPAVGNQFAVEYNEQSSCSFSNITVQAGAGRGLAGRAPQGTVTVQNVQVSGNARGEAFAFADTAVVDISDSGSSNSPSYGFLFQSCRTVRARHLTVRNAARTDALRRAAWFENGASVAVDGLLVIDDQTSATGDVIGAYDANGGVQNGYIRSIENRVTNGKLQVQNLSPGLVFGFFTP